MNIAETPTITVLPQECSQSAATEKFNEALASVELAPSVAESRTEFGAAEKRYAELTGTIGPLNNRGKQLTDELAALHQRIGDDFLAQFAAEGKATVANADLDCLTRNHAESRAVSQVLDRLGVNLVPEALIAKLSTESRVIFARAEELERVAAERFERTAELLRGAAEFESGIVINTQSSLSGVMVEHAKELRVKGLELARRAEEERRKYLNAVSEFALKAWR
jgi:hypothetical protein